MNLKQKMLKFFYPLLMILARKKGAVSAGKAVARRSFYLLKANLNDGREFYFNSLRGKKVMIINTASNCGYTAQYAEIQKLATMYPKIEILIFPSNDFKNQESGTDEEIAAFCRANFGLTVPLFKKCVVTGSPQQHDVFKWLTDKNLNGWNDVGPEWNFNKYLVDEKGNLTHVFPQSVSPLSKPVLATINS